MSCRQSFSMAPRESPSCKDKGGMPGQASAALPSHPQDAPTPERLPARCRQAVRDYAKNCVGRGKKKPHRSLRCCKARAFHQRPTPSCTPVEIAAGERTQGCTSPAWLRMTRSLLGCCAGVQGIHVAGSSLRNSCSSSTVTI